MSEIDSYKHELVGFLGYLPVYHALEKINYEFKCDENQLVLGGGDGEHPALVIDRPTKAVAYFLNAEIGDQKEIEHWKEIISPYLQTNMDDVMTFYEWTMERYSSFCKMSMSECLPNPSDGTEIEQWIILGIGEFIFFSMPHLAKDIMDKIEKPYKHFSHMRYNNILIVPPNIPVYANGGNMFFNKKKQS